MLTSSTYQEGVSKCRILAHPHIFLEERIVTMPWERKKKSM